MRDPEPSIASVNAPARWGADGKQHYIEDVQVRPLGRLAKFCACGYTTGFGSDDSRAVSSTTTS